MLSADLDKRIILNTKNGAYITHSEGRKRGTKFEREDEKEKGIKLLQNLRSTRGEDVAI